jgi:hypothetical protein
MFDCRSMRIKCPTSHDLDIFAAAPEELDETRYIEIREHLKKCPSCRYKVAWCREEVE